ncbi:MULTISPECIES: tetrathionate respiration response regulator TtrR [Providencia]|uniref:Response regulator n=3 Tax=Providencia alcalifaciens TaxID=126385 RepID=A0AAW9V9D0_9GAMM|nr:MULTISPECIES: tetrathionate respiration response regulator TtrR [Providencia]ATG17894.1 DNA-binding response regulator [Providencia alcalifaciens]EEB47233.1 response regulator receiver domain protein [Providencia alcalifaciens DSM 30120]EKT66470.1 two component system response regulator of tetrathionate reductase complex [Providencia alcalifaciens Dmel2]ETT03596.1 putative transcriptional regulatory protein FixJ [Providencia alcalifaciens F90-2004]EUC95152.1 putative transcriptional regulat
MPVIHLVDDDSDVTDSCQFLLETLGYSVTVWNDSEQFVQQAPLHEEGVVLLDMRMPKLDGRQVHQYLKEQQSTLAVIFLSGHGDIPMAVEQVKLGAIDFLQKPIDSQQLAETLEQARLQTIKATERFLIQQRYETLTPKEKDVCGYVLQGLINREIAEVACVSVRTVEVHRSRVMEKMAVRNLAELMSTMQAAQLFAD